LAINRIGRLETYGVSAFVAHDTIEPMSTWQREIEKGLETMEIMLAFITDDFHESSWTNQEIGYALGKDIPVIPVKLEGRDPDGFIGATQAVKGRLEQPSACVKKIYEILCDKARAEGTPSADDNLSVHSVAKLRRD
jgi:TIR domain